MKKNFVTIVVALTAALTGSVNPAYAVSKHNDNSHHGKAFESHTNSITALDAYDLRYGATYGGVIKQLIGNFDTAKMQLGAVVATACSALRHEPSGKHPYQSVLKLVYRDIAKQIASPRPPAFTQAMKECAQVFDRSAVR